MGWNGGGFGTMTFGAAEGLAAWRKSAVIPASFDDWTGVLHDPSTDALDIGRWLERLPKSDLGAIAVEVTGRAVSLAWETDKDRFQMYAPDVASVLRAGAAHGARGTFWLLGLAGAEQEFAHELALDGATSKITSLPAAKMRAVYASAACRALRERMHGPPRVGKTPGPEALAGVHAAIQRDVSAALEAIPESALLDAARTGQQPSESDVKFILKNNPPGPARERLLAQTRELTLWCRPGMPGDHRGSVRVTTLGKGKRGLLEYLRQPLAACESAALELLHLLDPAAAEAFAIRHAAEPFVEELLPGVSAGLRGCSSDASLASLAALCEGDVQRPRVAALMALGTSSHPGAGDFALGMLERTLAQLAPRRGPAVQYWRPDPPAARIAGMLVHVLGALGHAPARGALEKLAKKDEFRLAARRALEQIKNARAQVRAAGQRPGAKKAPARTAKKSAKVAARKSGKKSAKRPAPARPKTR